MPGREKKRERERGSYRNRGKERHKECEEDTQREREREVDEGQGRDLAEDASWSREKHLASGSHGGPREGIKARPAGVTPHSALPGNTVLPGAAGRFSEGGAAFSDKSNFPGTPTVSAGACVPAHRYGRPLHACAELATIKGVGGDASDPERATSISEHEENELEFRRRSGRRVSLVAFARGTAHYDLTQGRPEMLVHLHVMPSHSDAVLRTGAISERLQ